MPDLSNQDFKGLLLVHSVTTILSAMDDLKGTVLYSSKVAAVLDQFSETKLRKVFKNGAADDAAKGAVVFEKMIYATTCIQEQPAHVQERFDRDLEELMIRYGVNMLELEAI